MAKKSYPTPEDAVAWLVNNKSFALTEALTPWIKAGISIDKCLEALKEVGWPDSEIPSRSALGIKVRRLRDQLGIKTKSGRPRKGRGKPDAKPKRLPIATEVVAEAKGIEADGDENVEPSAQNPPTRVGFENIEEVSRLGAGKHPYRID